MYNRTIIGLLSGLFVIILANSCNKWTAKDSDIELSLSGGFQSRLEQIVQISWTPCGEIPNQSGYYGIDQNVTGIPYSSVKEKEKFVGQYVSFYTFMTAVKNPRSVLYTENVKQAPYHGTNCSSYYGTVCSMAVNYVLGLPYSFTTSQYKQLDSFYRLSPQTIEMAEPGDILLQDSKHVVMIAGLKKQSGGAVSSVSIFESSGGRGTRIDEYSRDALLSRWEKDGWELLRYKDVNNKRENISSMAFNNYPYDTPFRSPICCSRGDRATFAAGETVILNNLDEKPHRMRKIHDGVDEGLVETSGTDVSFSTLTPGIYTFDLSNPAWDNPSVEVIDATVSAERNGDNLAVSFSSVNAKPMSMIISNIHGNHYLVEPIDDTERAAGRKTLTIPKRSGQLYLKVMFEGQYGSVMNEPILIQ